jgi:hypothetical protein
LVRLGRQQSPPRFDDRSRQRRRRWNRSIEASSQTQRTHLPLLRRRKSCDRGMNRLHRRTGSEPLFFAGSVRRRPGHRGRMEFALLRRADAVPSRQDRARAHGRRGGYLGTRRSAETRWLYCLVNRRTCVADTDPAAPSIAPPHRLAVRAVQRSTPSGESAPLRASSACALAPSSSSSPYLCSPICACVCRSEPTVPLGALLHSL